MTMRDRLISLMEQGKMVELYFSPGSTYYMAMILNVGEDYLEFEAYDESQDIAIAHNILPLTLLSCVTVNSIECERERLEKLLRMDATD